MSPSEQLTRSAQELYDLVLRNANAFLVNSKHFTIAILQQENPTYEEVAEVMQTASQLIITIMVDVDPMMGQKAGEYVSIMARMAKAIRNDDQEQLSYLVSELERKPFL